MPSFTITQDERDTVGEILDLAFSDQEHWLNYGHPELDYDQSELEGKAETFRRFGKLGEILGFHGEGERWESLAKAVLGEDDER